MSTPVFLQDGFAMTWTGSGEDGENKLSIQTNREPLTLGIFPGGGPHRAYAGRFWRGTRSTFRGFPTTLKGERKRHGPGGGTKEGGKEERPRF